MDGWGFAKALAPYLPRTFALLVGGSALLWMIVAGDYRLIWTAMASGVAAVSEWLGLYDALTRVATP